MLLATCLECVFGRVFVGEVEAHFILNYPPPQVCTLKEKSPSFLEVPSHPQNPLGITASPPPVTSSSLLRDSLLMSVNLLWLPVRVKYFCGFLTRSGESAVSPELYWATPGREFQGGIGRHLLVLMTLWKQLEQAGFQGISGTKTCLD